MTSEDFTALETEIRDARTEIEEDNGTSPFHFLDDFYSGLDGFLLGVLDALREICINEELRPGDKPEETKSHIYDELEQVRQVRESLRANDVPVELYFLLEDIKNDLEIDLAVGLEPKNKFLIYKINLQFRMLQKIVFWDINDGDETKSHIIQFPRSEFRHALSYCLLVHECFHTKENLVAEAVSKLDELEDIPENKLEEICVDLFALNYIGPAYGLALAEIPDKFGRHDSIAHPAHQSRYKYIQQYLDYISEVDDEEDRGNGTRQKTLNSKPDYPEAFLDAQQKAHKEISQRQNSEGVGVEIENFEAFQSFLQQKLSDRNLPTYIDERHSTKYYLGMEKASPATVSKKLDKFLLKNDGNEIALPLKPILLFNLLLAIDGYETKTLHDVVLSSFKKWYVTRRTREEQEGRVS